MDKIISSPSKYVQGENSLDSLATYTQMFGSNPLVIADGFVTNLVGERVQNSFKSENCDFSMEMFRGECCQEEIKRLVKLCEANNSDIVIGIGGGKTLDTAKAIAYYTKLPVVIAPTIASSDAPCSAIAVIYTPSGEYEGYVQLPKNPEMVLMDTAIVAKAPVRLLVAGMGDALATYFEARANMNSANSTTAGGTMSAFALAKLCYETLLSDGYKAKVAVENGVSTKAVENIIEANTYLSGIGFESSGLAAAHAIHNGLTRLKECHHMYHGEKVAFGTLVQLVLENAPLDELNTVLDFCQLVGLPTNLFQLGVEEIDHEKLYEVAKIASVEGETIHNMPFEVTADNVYAAILTAHQLGLK